MSYSPKKHTSGFSLIEVVLYISLFSVISALTMNALFTTMKAFTNLRISRDINDSSVKIMERMTRDIKSATSVDLAYSTFNANPGRLTLSTVNASGTPMTIEYYIPMGQNALHVKENGVDRGSLLSSQTSISGVVFDYINTNRSIGIKIDLHVTASRGQVTDTDHFYNTVILRGTY